MSREFSRDRSGRMPPGRFALLRLWALSSTGRSPQALLRADAGLSRAIAEGWDTQLRLQMAWMCFQTGATARGAELIREVVATGETSLTPEQFAAAHAVEAWLLLETGALEEATKAAVTAAELADATGDLRVRSLASNLLGVIFWSARLVDRALELCTEAVRLARLAGDRLLEAWWLVNLGGANWAAADLALEDGHDPAARDYAKRARETTEMALRLARELGDTWTVRLALGNLADSAANAGDLIEADALLAEYRTLAHDLPLRDREHYLDVLATVMIKRGAHVAAIATLEEARRLAEASGNIESLLHAALHLSMALEGLGRFEQALAEHKLYHRLQMRVSAEHARRTARLAEVVLEADRLRRHAAQLAATVDRDPLTGAYNRRRLDLELARLAEGGKPYFIAMVDIDRFKSINDRFGHIIGDDVLKLTATLLGDAQRPVDVLVRFGGEEFVLLFEDLGADANAARLEDLRQAFVAHDWSALAAGLAVTVSIGAAASGEMSTVDDVMKLADTRLYAAKRGGRNRVVSLSPPTASLQQAG